MGGERRGICCIGPLNYDMCYLIDQYPMEGMLTSIRASSVQPGGLGNLMGQLAKLDSTLPLEFYGVVGMDRRGQWLEKSLTAMFPNISFSNALYVSANSFTVIMDSLQSKERTFFSSAGKKLPLDASNIDIAKIQSKYLVLEYLLEGGWLDDTDLVTGCVAASICQKAHQAGIQTVLDLCSHRFPEAHEICKIVFPHVDILSCNEIEASIASGIKQEDNDESIFYQLDAIKGMGISELIAIHTPKWCYLLDCKTENIWKSHAIEIDPKLIKTKTGAGDAFLAGLLLGSYLDYSMPTRMLLAVATARSSLEGVNGFETVMPADTLLERYEQKVDVKLVRGCCK